MSLGTVVAGLADDTAPARLAAGTVLSIDWPSQTALVNVAGGSVKCAMVGVPPLVNDAVQVLVVGGAGVILGTAARGVAATVTAVPVNGLVTVLAEDQQTYQLPYGVGLSLAVNDSVLIDWSTGGVVTQEITGTVSGGASSPTPPAPKPKPPSTGGGQVAKSRTFTPTASASRRGSWAQGIVYFGQSYSSAGFFYGSQIADSIPDGATLVSIKIYLEVTASSGVNYLTLGMHDQKTIPAGDLILSDAKGFDGLRNGFKGWVDLSGGVFFDRLARGLMFGISIKGPGYRRIAAAPTSGTISITWKE
jgi:hypothetical protein